MPPPVNIEWALPVDARRAPSPAPTDVDKRTNTAAKTIWERLKGFFSENVIDRRVRRARYEIATEPDNMDEVRAMISERDDRVFVDRDFKSRVPHEFFENGLWKPARIASEFEIDVHRNDLFINDVQFDAAPKDQFERLIQALGFKQTWDSILRKNNANGERAAAQHALTSSIPDQMDELDIPNGVPASSLTEEERACLEFVSMINQRAYSGIGTHLFNTLAKDFDGNSISAKNATPTVKITNVDGIWTFSVKHTFSLQHEGRALAKIQTFTELGIDGIARSTWHVRNL